MWVLFVTKSIQFTSIYIHIQEATPFNSQIAKLQIHHFSTFQAKGKPESQSKEATATYK